METLGYLPRLRNMVDWEYIAVALLAFAVFSSTLDHGFVYDDNRAILTNPDVKASNALTNVFLHDFWGTPLSSSNSHGSYRPLCVLTFRLNHWISGLRPYSFHLTNVLLHTVATILVLKTSRTLLPGRSPLIASCVFAVHPIHVEAVAGIVGRADIMACIFYLLSFLFYMEHVKHRDRTLKLSGGVVKNIFSKKLRVLKTYETRNQNTFPISDSNGCFSIKLATFSSMNDKLNFVLFILFAVCALLNKEIGITVIPLAIYYDVILHLRSKKISSMNPCVVASALSSLLCFAALLLGRMFLMGMQTPQFSTADNPTAKDPSFITRTLTFIYLPVFNFFLLLFPKWLSFDWSMDAIPRVTSVTDYRLIISLVFYITLYHAAKYVFRCVSSVGNRCKKPLSCKVCSSLSCRDHFLTCRLTNNNNLPPHCDCLKTTSKKPKTKGFAVTLCLAFIVSPFLPASNILFYVGFVVAERILYLPSVGFCMLVALGAHTLWGCQRPLAVVGCLLLLTSLTLRTLQRNKDWADEESLYRSAVHINPPKAYGNLGSVLSTAGRLEEAGTALRAALWYRPNMADVHYNLGNLLSRQNRTEEAVSSYKQAIHYRSSLAVAYLALGRLLVMQGKWQDAEDTLRKCWQCDVTGLKDPRAHEEARSSCLQDLRTLCTALSCQPSTLQILHHVINSKGHTPFESQAFEGATPVKNILTRERSFNKITARNKTKVSKEELLFLRAIEKDPSDPAVYINYGHMLAQQGAHHEAAPLYLKAAQLAPQHYSLVLSAAVALRHAGQFAEAETMYRRARDLRPTNAASHSNLGAILHLQGKFKEAAHCYKEALRRSPGDHVTLTNLQKLKNLASINQR